jgi:hypothetical protein
VVVLVPALVSIPLGLTVYVLARGDLARMRAGTMDPRARTETETASAEALCGILLPLFPLGSFVLALAMGL